MRREKEEFLCIQFSFELKLCDSINQYRASCPTIEELSLLRDYLFFVSSVSSSFFPKCKLTAPNYFLVIVFCGYKGIMDLIGEGCREMFIFGEVVFLYFGLWEYVLWKDWIWNFEDCIATMVVTMELSYISLVLFVWMMIGN